MKLDNLCVAECRDRVIFGMPAFLAICHLGTRDLRSVSGTIILVASVIVFLSGFLPGEGFLWPFMILPTMLFSASESEFLSI